MMCRKGPTYNSFWASIVLGELEASIADSWSIDERCELRHVLRAKLVKHVDVGVLELRKVDVFLNIFVLGTKLGQTANSMDISVQGRWSQAMRWLCRC